MIFPVCPKKGRKEISEPENHRFRGFKKKKIRIQEQLLLVPLVLKTLKNQRFSIKEPANELAVLWLRLFDLSNLLRIVVIDQNWGFLRTTVMNPWNHPDNLHWEKKSVV